MRKMMRKLAALWCVFGLLAAVSAGAAVTVPSVIGDHMLVQQGIRIPVWGKADPGEQVTVTLGDDTAEAVADDDGRWLVSLPKQKAGGPLDMTISGKDGGLTVSDILVGEVWVCSGQSNMQFGLASSNNAEAEIAAAKYPEMRLFTVERTVATEAQEDCTGSWSVCSPETVAGFSAVGYFFGRELHTTLGVPVGLIHTSWGGTPAESWTTQSTLESDPDFTPMLERWANIEKDYPAAKAAHDAAMAEWQAAAEKAKAEGKPEPQKPPAPMDPMHAHRPAGLYNAMIAPLIPYAIQGAIWYQGESNASRAYQYRKLFPAMIEDWRRAWDQGAFPFLFVQLANWRETKADPEPSDWAELREAQVITLGLKNTGMAVIIDIGDAKDIHPRNKQDVGKRLALNALANTYGKRIPYSGPIYKSMKAKGDTVEIKFTRTDGGLVAKDGGALQGFAIAGEDQKFVWADAVIEGEKVVVSADGIEAPVAVRYAWADNPICNLHNGAGLPASPFRTDDWPGVTVDKR